MPVTRDVASGAPQQANPSNIQGKASVFGVETSNLNANGTRKSDFLSREEVIMKISSSYQSVEKNLESSDFVRALSRHGIQIIDKSGKVVGSKEPKIRFIYEQKLNRLIRTREGL
jgi:hypothetical protein